MQLFQPYFMTKFSNSLIPHSQILSLSHKYIVPPLVITQKRMYLSFRLNLFVQAVPLFSHASSSYLFYSALWQSHFMLTYPLLLMSIRTIADFLWGHSFEVIFHETMIFGSEVRALFSRRDWFWIVCFVGWILIGGSVIECERSKRRVQSRRVQIVNK